MTAPKGASTVGGNNMRARAAWLGAGFIVAAAMAGPSEAQSSPRDAASRFLDTWSDKRWAEAARLLDLDHFDRFRQDFIGRAGRRSDNGPPMTVEEMRRRDPDMPREVAEYYIRQMREQEQRSSDPTPFEFARVRSVSELRGLTAEEAAARWLESRDPAYQIRVQFEGAGCPVPRDADSAAAPERRLLGVVADGDTAAYAVFREQAPDQTRSASEGGDLFVMELKLRRGRWMVEPRSDLLPEIGMVDTEDCRRGRSGGSP